VKLQASLLDVENQTPKIGPQSVTDITLEVAQTAAVTCLHLNRDTWACALWNQHSNRRSKTFDPIEKPRSAGTIDSVRRAQGRNARIFCSKSGWTSAALRGVLTFKPKRPTSTTISKASSPTIPAIDPERRNEAYIR